MTDSSFYGSSSIDLSQVKVVNTQSYSSMSETKIRTNIDFMRKKEEMKRKPHPNIMFNSLPNLSGLSLTNKVETPRWIQGVSVKDAGNLFCKIMMYRMSNLGAIQAQRLSSY
jgi:hypothetical protein